ncbi:MAG: hypothetical protein B7X59_01325 [Polaromonas sp. 39-63-203]|jgi:uncharacterized protein with NRDE domain|uniref:NRDE family protein n=1 Tax=Polaromonas sp. TaxID=1869339 RepID=UPI000BDDB944|nr:NRDE family protein [Polaromonas sp.]OYY52599.1 MAG: hypothetical protein B7Y54_06285 [Polaromonas sp. 35-63-240]OYZ01070.1 MAG: hypothetical protein B7Y42_03970 [Polaromonas sp. 28-63-22]OYZ83924.1 MAG: hypothetical protein B7Y03_06660 [Polaromonas sp. 24-62-144]OZB01252.1 MAG: hypothetical protein B7X59_01325 [Polaromonas sp. 39-63-203]HQS33083.1 NRDE family protein [Polaromonas sp.]
MCLIAFAIQASSRWPLVIAANRDEYIERPTTPLARWQTPSGATLISGRDLRAGGTWFGVTPGGRVAFLTNVREGEASPAPRSRGELVTRWLESQDDAGAFAAGLASESQHFGGFNLVLGDFARNHWTWMTNRWAHGAADQARHDVSHGAPWHQQSLAPGVYGLSNAALDSPWPKTTQLKSVLSQSLRLHEPGGNLQALQADLWRALGNRERASAHSLPHTGMAPAREEALSSAFVEYPEHGYGTRNSTLLTATAHQTPGHAGLWDVTMEEREHLRGPAAPDESGRAAPWHARRESLRWQV